MADEQLNDNIAYICEVQAEVKNLKNFKIIEQFEFSSQKIGISISPIAKKYINNIQDVGDQFNYLLDSTLYILAHSMIIKDEKQYFNISGIINNQKPKFEKIDLSLNAMSEVEKENKETELNCSIIEIINDNYTLRCKGDKNINYNLKNAMSIIENEILLISFDENANSNILFESSSNTVPNHRYFFSRSNGNLNIGAIVAIILCIILVLVTFVVVYICLNKRKPNNENITESSVRNINI